MGLLKKDKEKDLQPKPMTQPVVQRTNFQAKKGNSFISQGLIFKGEISGNDDITIEGNLEGKIDVKAHILIQQTGNVKAEIFAKKVTIAGKVFGNVQAEEMVEIQPSGFLEGNIVSPKITIMEGAHFKGNVDMKSNVSNKGEGI